MSLESCSIEWNSAALEEVFMDKIHRAKEVVAKELGCDGAVSTEQDKKPGPGLRPPLFLFAAIEIHFVQHVFHLAGSLPSTR
eukprot:1949097-Ditylum_brightwellii.AAC.1